MQFGGKLITFGHDKAAVSAAQQNAQQGQPPASVPREVYVSQVVTEEELIKKSTELEQALEYGNFTGNFVIVYVYVPFCFVLLFDFSRISATEKI